MRKSFTERGMQRLGALGQMYEDFCNNIHKAAILFLNLFVFTALMIIDLGNRAIPASTAVHLNITGKRSTQLYVKESNENKLKLSLRKRFQLIRQNYRPLEEKQ